MRLKLDYSYDPEANAVYMRVSDRKPADCVVTEEGINLDVTADGELTGIEILNVSKVAPALIPESAAADTAAE
ncbi:MAG: DUF2283 domain-containing protein [Pseudomonadota bacterium]